MNKNFSSKLKKKRFLDYRKSYLCDCIGGKLGTYWIIRWKPFTAESFFDKQSIKLNVLIHVRWVVGDAEMYILGLLSKSNSKFCT